MGRGYVSGALADYAEGFRSERLDRGYTEASAARLIHLMAHVSRWLDEKSLAVAEFSGDRVEAFVASRRAEGYASWRSARALAPMLEYLSGLGVVHTEGREPDAVSAFLVRYDSYLVAERGATADTRRAYLGGARRFMDHLSQHEAEDLSSLTAGTVSEFVRAECARRSAGSASSTTTAMRSLLRFLYLERITPVLLTAAVPSPARWSLAGLPRAVSAAQAADLLASCDRRSAAGRRDFAILTLLVRLGLRAGEVADLQLDHIDWHHGELRVSGKAHRAERLPVPPDVGKAIVDWLTDGRIHDRAGRAVFCRLRPPYGPMTAGTVGAVVRRACQRSGYPPVGPHRLRHTTGTELLRAGANLNEVGRVLRHRRLHTTAIYAKVDLAALAELSRPWPERRP